MNTWLSENVVRAIGWTLVHFVWEGLVIAALLAVILRALRRSPAHWRYLAGCAAMVMMAVAPLVTFQLVMGRNSLPPVATTAEVAPMVPVESQVLRERSAPVSGVALSFAHPIESPMENEAAARKSVRLFGHQLETPYVVSCLINKMQRLEVWMPWLVVSWLVGVGLLSCRLLVGWWQVRRLTRRACSAVGEVWEEKLAELARRLGITRPIRLLQSALVEVPTVVGWLRPVILLPASCLTGLAPNQLEAILAHELAHIRRHDYLINLLQSAVETLLFYHPAVWWVSRKVREERENCCDDLAVAVSGDRVGYARALATLEELRPASAQLALAAGGAPLLQRIRRLAGQPERGASRASWPVAGIILIMGLGLVALGMKEHRAQAAEQGKAQAGVYRDPWGNPYNIEFGNSALPTNAAPVVRDLHLEVAPPDQTRELLEILASAQSGPVVPAQPNVEWHIETLDNRAATNADLPVDLETRTFRVEPVPFLKALSANVGVNLVPGQSPSGGGTNGGATVSGGPPVAKVTVSGNGFGGGGFGGSSPGNFVTVTRGGNSVKHEDIEAAIRSFFKGTGVDLGTNTGKAVIYDTVGNTLTVRATKPELDLIGATVASLNEHPLEVNIKTKFLEFDERDENLLDKLVASAPRITNGLPSPASVGLPDRNFGGKVPAGAITTNGATVTCILTDAQFRNVISALEQRDGTQVLSAPEVTTESGRQAQMQAVDIQQIVTGVSGPGLVPTTTTMSFGPELDVVPYVDANRSNITMAVIPSLTDFVGYDNPGQFMLQGVGTNGEKITSCTTAATLSLARGGDFGDGPGR